MTMNNNNNTVRLLSPLLICGIIQLLDPQQVVVLVVDAYTLLSIPIPTSRRYLHTGNGRQLLRTSLFASSSNNNNNEFDGNEKEEEEEVYYTPQIKATTVSEADDNDNNNDNNSDNGKNFMDDLTPPAVNFARNSILFSENPATKRRNSSKEAWIFVRTYFPAFLTGAWPWRDIPTLDERPLGALYNAAFVRLPVVGVGLAYLYQKIVSHHGLIIDFGFDPLGGPQEMNPIVVIGILVFILL